MSDQSLMKRALRLFLVFFRIGAFTFGGGYAMVPLIQREIAEKNDWIRNEDIVDIFAVVQSVPGVIAINSSIFVGYKVAGFPGALAATLGVALPSVIIITIIALFLYSFRELPHVHEAFNGIRAGVTALVLYAVIKLGKPSVKKTFGWLVAVGAFLAVAFLQINAIMVLLAAAILGLCFHYPRKGKSDGREGSVS